MIRFIRALADGVLAAVMVLAMIAMAFWGFVLMGLLYALRAATRR